MSTVCQPTAAVFHYAAYNMRIRSELALSELPPASAGDDFEILLDRALGPVENRAVEWQEEPSEARFYYPGLARFVVRGGRELIITADPRGDLSILRLYVQGMMLAAALYQRGYFVLHSSVVDFEGRGLAFMGPVGAGKSTFASAFHASGHKILADDNAALDLEGALPRVLPGFPSLKVYPAVAHSLGFDCSSLKPMHDSQVKQAQPVADAFSSVPLPLHCIYVLDPEAVDAPSRLSPIESITELIRHSVPARWGVRADARHLAMCARLAKTVPIFRVRTFAELSEIPTIARRIQDHTAALSPRALLL